MISTQEKTIGQKKIMAASMPLSKKFWQSELSNTIPTKYLMDFHQATDEVNAIRHRAVSEIDVTLFEMVCSKYDLSNDQSKQLFSSLVLTLLYIIHNGVEEQFCVGYNTKRYSHPLKAAFSNTSFNAVVAEVSSFITKVYEHRKYPVELLMPTNYVEITFDDVDDVIESVDNEALTFNFSHDSQRKTYLITVTGSESYFLKETINSIADKMVQLLNLIASSAPETKLLEFDLFNDQDMVDYTQLNDTAKPFSNSVTLVDIATDIFSKFSDRTVTVINGKKYSYKDLDQRSNEIAKYLLDNLEVKDEKIGIFQERSFDYISTIYGILRAGKTYVPMDTKAPTTRNDLIVKQSCMTTILTADKFKDKVPTVKNSISVSEIQATGKIVSLPTIKPSDIAYIIFTSGSTGLPKGVSVSHRSVINRIQWMQNEYQLTLSDTILHKTPVTFDVSVWELFWWMMVGAKVSLLEPDQEGNPEAIIDAIEQQAVTTIHFVPSMLNAFLDYTKSVNAQNRLTSLKRVFCSGEALSPRHVEKFYKLFENVELVNLYGPTEATVDVSYHLTKLGENPVPIGRPIDNDRLYILDQNNHVRPTGMIGELCIAGEGVSAGYLNDPERTKVKFKKLKDVDSGIIYFTGDLARLRHDGTIEYFGRNDSQVKVRGFRIELGEIESAISKQNYINENIVLTKTGKDDILRLYAFVVLNNKKTAEEIKKDIAQCVPKYMVPDQVIILKNMPVTANGKADRKLLLTLPDKQNDVDIEKIPPKTKVEKTLAKIWQDVLGVKEVGITDNFFALGGNSINFVSVLAKANKENLKFTFQQLFKYPTIADLLRNVSSDENEDETIPEIIEKFSMISIEDRNKMPVHIEDAYPMSYLQAGLVYQSMTMQGQNNYHDIVSYQIDGEIDIKVFEQAVDRLVKTQPIFRTSYDLDHYSEYLQLVHKTVSKLPLNIYDLSGLSSQAEKDKAFDEWFWKEQHRSFIWNEPGLVQFHIHIMDKHTYKYSISQHNSALDGWSMNQVHTYLFKTYFNLLNNDQRLNKKLANNNNNRNFIYLENKAVKSPTEKEFWENQLISAPSGQIPRSRESKKELGNEVVFKDIKLPEGLSESLIDLSVRMKVPVKDVLLASHIKFLSLLTNKKDVFTGYEIGGRPELPGAETALGVFLNTMPFRIKINDDSTWGDLIKSVYDTEAQVLPHRRYPMAKVMQDRSQRNILFESVFNFTHFYSLKEIRDLPGFDLVDVRAAAITEFPLRTEFSRHFYNDQVELALHYHTAEYDSQDIDEFGQVFIDILKNMVNNTDSQQGNMQSDQVLSRFNIKPKSDDVMVGNSDVSENNNETENLSMYIDQVKKVWSQTLNIPDDQINLDDDFFQIGGDSLTAMRVSLLLGKKVSLKKILQKSVLKELASELAVTSASSTGSTENNGDILQCLSKNSLAPLNVIFLPYAGGNAINFMPIARAFDKFESNVSVYAAEMPGHDPNIQGEKLLNFNEMVDRTVSEIERRFKGKKFVIWGHCVGSALAIEVTHRLEDDQIAPQELFIGGKLLMPPLEIKDTIHNAQNLKFSDIAEFHAEWTGNNVLSTYGSEYEDNLVKSFSNDSIELNKYLLNLWNQNEKKITKTKSLLVVTEDDPVTIGFENDWMTWSNHIADIKLKTYAKGGHYFQRTLPDAVAQLILNEISN